MKRSLAARCALLASSSVSAAPTIRVGSLELQPQTTAQLLSGRVGLWYDSGSLQLKLRRADGTDTALGGGGGGGFYQTIYNAGGASSLPFLSSSRATAKCPMRLGSQ